MELVDSYGFALDTVRIDEPGLYEFQLLLVDSDELLAGERMAVPPIEDDL